MSIAASVPRVIPRPVTRPVTLNLFGQVALLDEWMRVTQALAEVVLTEVHVMRMTQAVVEVILEE